MSLPSPPVFKFPESVYRRMITIVNYFFSMIEMRRVADAYHHKMVGAMANWILYGVLWVQIYLYYIAFPKDKPALKTIVFLVLVLETVQSVAVTHDLVQFCTSVYANPFILEQIGTLWYSVALLSGLIALLTQAFYCFRAAVLTKSKSAVVLIMMLSLCQFAAAVAVTVQTKEANLRANPSLFSVSLWATSSLACDVVIAAIMTYYLKKRDSGIKKTHSIVVRLIVLSIETGCVTAALAAILLVLVHLPGHPEYYIADTYVVAKTYSNSMMAVLNSRVKVISNSHSMASPTWNELEVSTTTSVGSVDIEFRRGDETSFYSSRTM